MSGKAFVAIAVWGVALGGAHGACAQSFDMVILGGRVMDPASGRDEVINVGIRDGRIAAITAEAIKGRRMIDARQLVVSPGFIDLHVHAVDSLSRDYLVRDGVTSAFELELGAYPLEPYYQRISKHARMNYGASSGYLQARVAAATDSQARDTGSDPLSSLRQSVSEDVQRRAHRLVIEGLAAGGIGVGLPLEYMQGADHADVFRLFKALAPDPMPVFVHTREFVNANTGQMLSAMQEVIANAAVTGVPLHIVHVSSKGLGDTPIILEAIRSARARGVDITAEVPSYAMATGRIGSALFDPGWTTRWNSDYSALENPATGERLTKQSFDELRAQSPDAEVMKHITPETAVDAGMLDPDVMIASDAVQIWEERAGNPRTSGTFSRTLGFHVRERRLLDLMTALKKMTLMPAMRIEAVAPAMRNRGRLAVGAAADITIFDPRTVRDRGTTRTPAVTPVGIPYVIVNGTVVVDAGALVRDAFPGQAIYGKARREKKATATRRTLPRGGK